MNNIEIFISSSIVIAIIKGFIDLGKQKEKLAEAKKDIERLFKKMDQKVYRKEFDKLDDGFTEMKKTLTELNNTVIKISTKMGIE